MLPTIATGNVGSALAGEYEVANSLRFNDDSSDRLTITPSSTNRKTFTFSAWIKRANIGGNQSLAVGFDNSNNYTLIRLESDKLHVFTLNGGSFQFQLKTNRLLRDVSAWYHIVVAIDTSQATSSNRVKLYINNNQETSLAESSYPSQNDFTFFNHTFDVSLGYNGAGDYFDGYMAEVCFIDGQQLDPTSFGEFDSDTNIWKPIDVSGLTFGTNGFYLDFENSGSLGADVSGNGNNFTVNNLTSVDQSTDTCTNNFATYNPIFGIGRQDQLTYSEGNTVVVSGATSGSDTTATSTFAFDSGKWYAEFKLTNDANGVYIGVATSNFNFTNSGVDTSGQSENWIVRGDDGTIRNNGSTAYFGTSFSNDDIIQIAIDMDNSKIWWGLNGTYANSGNPATGSNPAFSNLSGELMIIVGDNFSSKTPTIKANFGSPAFSISSGNSDADGHGNFEYSVPSGYYALNTKNLAEYG
jgi:hypothetical protein